MMNVSSFFSLQDCEGVSALTTLRLWLWLVWNVAVATSEASCWTRGFHNTEATVYLILKRNTREQTQLLCAKTQTRTRKEQLNSLQHYVHF